MPRGVGKYTPGTHRPILGVHRTRCGLRRLDAGQVQLGARPTYVHPVVQPVVDECTWESRSYKVTSRRADRRVDTVSSGVEGPYSPARANVASGREKACRGRVRRNCQILKLVLGTELEARCTAHTPSLYLRCWNRWDVVPAVACPRSRVILVVTFDVRPRLRRKCRGV